MAFLLPALSEAQIQVNLTGVNIGCNGNNSGSATSNPSGGWFPYTFLWSNGATTQTISGLSVGTYCVTVTDIDQGTASGCINITQPNPLEATVYGQSQICGNVPDGFASVVPSGGTPPFTYLWSNGGVTPQINNLVAGVYTVTVHDAAGCTFTGSFTVGFWDEGIWIMAAVTGNIPCFGFNNGSATVTTMSGTPPFMYTWSNGATTQSIDNLAPGAYTVTVKDVNNCSNFATVNISQPPPLVVTSSSIPGNCGLQGSATVTASGGTPPYVYNWSNGQSSPTISVAPDTYTATVTDANACSKTASVTVTSNNNALTVNMTAQSPAGCIVGGSALAMVVGGSGNYAFLWDNGQTVNPVNNLSSGPHNVTITDINNGCQGIGMVTITGASALVVTATMTNPATCLVGGTATASASGGVAPYTFEWDNMQMTPNATGLLAGVHMVTATDASGCTGTTSVTITQLQGPTVSVTVNSNATCLTGGKATATPAGGTPGYTYQWSPSAGGQTTPMATNLPAGAHSVTVTDAAGCPVVGMVTITGSQPPIVIIVAPYNANCSTLGGATAMASGGTGPYTYHWSSGANTAVATNLPAGTNTVTVTDAAGCTATASVQIFQINNGINIGDWVWFDNDMNGHQHPTLENGVPNITVMLIKPGPDGEFGTADDMTAGTATTDATGHYLIGCVTPGTYILMFSGIPAGFEWTGKDAVNNDCEDSDVKPSGKTSQFTILAGQPDDLCLDGGIHSICANVMNAGAICCNQTICEGDVPAPIIGTQAPTGGSGQIQFMWVQFIQIGPAPPSWQPIPGANGANYQPGALFESTKFMRCARREGCITWLESNIVEITVKPAGSPGCFNFTQNFTVYQSGQTGVLINWTTIPEATAYSYTVQHSTDQQDWDDVETIIGKQDAVNPNHYDYLHETPVVGKNFYRIMRLSSMGQQAFSETRSLDVQFSSDQGIRIVPNPVVNKLHIMNVIQYDSDVTIDISATNGDLLHHIVIPAGTMFVDDLPVQDLPTGIYIAVVRFGNGDVKTLKIAKI